MDIESLKKNFSPDRTALIVIDMQRDYCCKGGVFDKMGCDLAKPQALAVTLASFVDKVRPVLRRIVHVKMTVVPELRSPSLVEHFARTVPGRVYEPSFGEFYGVEPAAGDIVIPKYRYSGFVSTYLDQLLRGEGITSLVFTGVATNVCVESTVRDAFMRDYYVVVPSDMTEATSIEAKESSLKNIDSFFGMVVESRELLKCWCVEE